MLFQGDLFVIALYRPYYWSVICKNAKILRVLFIAPILVSRIMSIGTQ